MSVRFVQGLLAIKSVLLGIFIGSMWVRSHAVADALRWGNKTQHVEIGSAAGSVFIRYANDARPSVDIGVWEIWHSDPPQLMLMYAGMGESAWNKMGFGVSKQAGDRGVGVVVNLMVPHFLLILLAIPGPVVWVWHWHHRRRRWRLGTISWCPNCWCESDGIMVTCPKCGGAVATHFDEEDELPTALAR
jgi:hypothetical protein